jgi:hypothetical protein
MCECDDIMTVLRMSSTCHKLREIWLDNISSIVRAVFEFTRWELLEYLKLAIIEESSTQPQPYQTPTEPEEIAVAVRHHLAWLERSAFAIPTLKRTWAEHVAGHTSRYGFRPENPNFHDFVHVRRLVAGFDHTVCLPAAYAAVKAMSDEQLKSAIAVGHAIDELSCEESERIGFERQSLYLAEWEDDSMPYETNLPHPWAFALYALQMESDWRPATVNLFHEEKSYFQYKFFRDFFGSEKMVAMYGEDKCPYTETRREAREIWQRENPDDLDGMKFWRKTVSGWRTAGAI